MKKRLLAAMLALILMIAPLTVPAYAYQPGEEIGQVLYTDIVAYIDGHAIRSYNINWNTYIVVEDLMAYGFAVSWLPEEGRLVIAKERTAAPDAYTADYTPEANTHPAGTPAMPYLYTEITTWIGDTQVTGYNIGGYTCICMDDLAAHFAGEYVWSPEDKALYMTSPALPSAEEQEGAAETPAPEPEQEPGSPAPEPPAQTQPEASFANGAEAAVDAYIRADIEEALSGDFTGENAAIMEEYEDLYGRDLVDELIAVTVEINDTLYWEITGSEVQETEATVYVTVTCRDLSSAVSDYSGKLMATMLLLSLRGEELSLDESMQLSLRLLLESLGNDELPLVTTKTVAYLELTDGAWVVDEEKSADFVNALAGGMMSDPLWEELSDTEAGDPLL